MSIFSKLKNITILVAMFFIAGVGYAQTVVTGKVTDKSNNPIADANVTVKETRGGTATDAAGIFRINVPANGKTLVISSVGYETQEVAISGSEVNVSLKTFSKDLGEVVVIGYGTRKKGDLTASITTVSAKDFQKGVITTPEQLIAGKVAGVSVVSNSGAPGAGSTIRIRGGASLNASNDPLIVIDNVPVSNGGIAGAPNPLSLINPNDIESFTILKDAAATAIYGSRASNGVILITTKRGKKGGTILNFSTVVSMATPDKTADVMSADEFRNFVKAKGTAAQIAQLGNASTNWQDEIYKNAIAIDNNLSLSGMFNKIPYRVSLGYLNQNGILLNDNLSRTSVGINVNPAFLNNHLKVDFGFKTAFTKTEFSDRGAIGSAVSFDPTKPVNSGSARFGGFSEYLNAGNVSGLEGLAPRNPVGLIEQKQDIGKSNRIIANIKVDYKFHFLPDLTATVNVATDRSNGKGTILITDSAAATYKRSSIFNPGTTVNGVNNEYKQENSNDLLEAYLNYTKNVNAIKSRFELMGGYTYQSIKSKSYSFADFAYNKTQVSNNPQFPFYDPESVIISYIGRLNWTINNKYLLSASIRRDGSSRFSEENRWGLFPGGSFAWKIKEEGFLKNVDAVNDLKLRLGYGVTGQQEIGDYEYQSAYSISGLTSQTQFGNNFIQNFTPGPYDGLRKWEETATSNVGLDFSLFNNRFSGTVDYYIKKTSDLLSPKNQPAGTNFANVFTGNIGDMENKGVEVNLNVVAYRKRDLNIDFNFNFTRNKNEITKLAEFNDPNFPGFEVGGISGGTGNNIQIHTVGQPRASFYVYKQVYDPVTNKPIDNLFVDLDGDGSITDKDRYRFFNPDPKFLFGFSPSVSYKKWTGGFVIRAATGNYMYNNNASSRGTVRSILNPLGFLTNGSRNVLESDFLGAGTRFFSSDYYVENASFLRMDNLSIGYNAGRLFKGSNAGFRFSFNVQNVFVATNYTGIDPEVNGGIDNTIYARPRTFSLGINVDLNLKK